MKSGDTLLGVIGFLIVMLLIVLLTAFAIDPSKGPVREIINWLFK